MTLNETRFEASPERSASLTTVANKHWTFRGMQVMFFKIQINPSFHSKTQFSEQTWVDRESWAPLKNIWVLLRQEFRRNRNVRKFLQELRQWRNFSRCWGSHEIQHTPNRKLGIPYELRPLLSTQRLASLGQTAASANPPMSQKKLWKTLDVEQPPRIACRVWLSMPSQMRLEPNKQKKEKNTSRNSFKTRWKDGCKKTNKPKDDMVKWSGEAWGTRQRGGKGRSGFLFDEPSASCAGADLAWKWQGWT